MPDYVDSGYVLDGYIGQPGSQAAFLYGAQSITFRRAPSYPQRPLSFSQAERQSTGAVRFVYDYLIKNDLIGLTFRGMPEWEKVAFVDFWLNAARGMANAFTFVDVAGVAASVRFASPTLPEIQEIAYNAYEVTCQLRVQ